MPKSRKAKRINTDQADDYDRPHTKLLTKGLFSLDMRDILKVENSEWHSATKSARGRPRRPMQFSFGSIDQRVVNLSYNPELFERLRLLTSDSEKRNTIKLVKQVQCLIFDEALTNSNDDLNFFTSNFSCKQLPEIPQTAQEILQRNQPKEKSHLAPTVTKEQKSKLCDLFYHGLQRNQPT